MPSVTTSVVGRHPRRERITGIVPFYLLGTLAFALHATLGIPLGDVARPRVLVVVRTEGHAAADPQMLADVASVARDIWRPYVDVAFGRAGDIRRTIEVDQIDLLVTDRRLNEDDATGLGWTEFVDGQPSHNITVSTTAAEQLLDSSSWSGRPLRLLPATIRRQFLVRALGRTVAHEMGHYLLRSKAHGRRGLMRDHFTSEEIMEPRYIKERLEADDLRKLGGRLNEYAAAMSRERPLS